MDARTKRRLRRSRTQRTSYSVKANDGKASEQSVQLFDSTSVTENSSKSNENFCFSQNNLSQDVTLSFPLELLSGTEFVHSQPNASSGILFVYSLIRTVILLFKLQKIRKAVGKKRAEFYKLSLNLSIPGSQALMIHRLICKMLI